MGFKQAVVFFRLVICALSVSRREIYCRTVENANLINIALKTTTSHLSAQDEILTSPTGQCQRAVSAFIKVCFGDQGVGKIKRERTDL